MDIDTTAGAPSSASGADMVLIRTHPGLCLGWGNCHRFAPDVYPLDGDGKVDIHRLAVPQELAYDAWIGAAACPEHAITVIGLPPHPQRARRRAD